MASVVMTKFKYESGIAGINLSADPLKVALIDNIFTTSAVSAIANTSDWGDVSATWEITGTGYTAGGAALTGCNVIENDSLTKMVFSATDVTWSSSTVNAYGATIYRISDRLPVCAIDFGGVKSSVVGNFTIQWNSNGVLNLS